MSLSDTDVKAKYNANGVTTTFAITFPEVDEYDDEVEVMTIDESSTPAVETVKTVATHYTIAGTTVTFLVAPANGLKVLVCKKMALVQTNFEGDANGPYPAVEAETAYDRLTNMIQILDEKIKRSLKFRKSYTTVTDPVMPDLTGLAGATIIVNTAETGFEEGPTATEIETAEASAIAAAASAAAALVSQIAAAASAVAAAASAVAAAASATALAVTGSATVTDGQAATAVTSMTADGATFSYAEFFCGVLRGTTVCWVRVILMYDGSTWTIEEADGGGGAHGLTFTVSQAGAVGQVEIAADSSGNGSMRFSRRAV